jgi:MFS transporter, ACS family, hexuronate transporter
MRRITNLRWWIAGLLATATALNYLDRQSLPVLISELQKTMPISDRQYSHLQIIFLLAYSVMYAGGGRIVDKLGTRTGYALMIWWWSAASLAHGLVSTFLGLATARFFLGLGEGGSFPGCAKAVSEWFPAEERSIAFGIFNSGSAIGAIIAPPLIAVVTLRLGWRWVFYLSGTVGFLWGIFWVVVYRLPQHQPLIQLEERAHIEASRLQSRIPPRSGSNVRLLDLLRYPQVWGLLSARFLSDAGGYFFILWIPKYLGEVRHLNIRQIGYYAWIPYFFAGLGSFIGGWLSSWLLRHHSTMNSSRKITLALSALLIPSSLLIVKSPLGWALCIFSLVLFGHQSWSTIMQTLVADMFSPQLVGSLAGLSGAAGAFGGILFNAIAGSLLDGFGSYAIVFLIAGLLHPLAFLLILTLINRIGPVACVPAESSFLATNH